MAKKNSGEKMNYNAEVSQLREQGPGRFYFLFGPEDFLREKYVEELEKLCVPDDMGFSLKKLDGSALGVNELRQAVDSMPFFTDRTLVEVRGYDVNKCRDSELDGMKKLVGDIPDYCTVVFIIPASYELDGRTGGVKFFKSAGKTLEFCRQGQESLIRWVRNRFSAAGKSISAADAEYLVFLSGSLMNGLIPEIDKIAAFSKGGTVGREDIEKTANRVPEAQAYDMINLLFARRYDEAAAKMGDLYYREKDNHPLMLLALIGSQLRRMYIVKLGLEERRNRAEIMELSGIKFDFAYNSTVSAVRGMELERLSAMVELCAEYDYKMKSAAVPERELMEELFARIAVGK